MHEENHQGDPQPFWLKSTVGIISPSWLEPRWNLIWSIQLSVGALCTSFIHVALVVWYRLWNLELGESPFVSLLWADSERIQWKFVGAGRQERQDQWNREGCAHQATVQWCSDEEQPRHLHQWREISKRETVARTDRRCVQTTGRIGALWRQTADATPRNPPELEATLHGNRTTSRRIAWSHFEAPEAPRGSRSCQRGSEATIINRPNSRNSNHSLHHLRGFARQMDLTMGYQSIINRQARAGERQYRQRGSCAIPSRSTGPSPYSHATSCTAEWNTGQYYRHVRRIDPREQACRTGHKI